ncbi:TetR/AcrR family transcriptional regulator [Nocardiopsis rhodophaea]|uniref:TetR/AcrR family transcriptional regulator n=1 Tax=Nocardiopsis rhodophaea TaxID=280238 RepID=A0ABN2T8C9_9ACTN
MITAAAELIGERGWSAVSTRTLAERAGVGPGLVHYHFASLQALRIEAAAQMMSAVAEGATARLETAADAEEGLALIIRDLDRFSGDDPMSRLFIEAYLASTRDEELRRAISGVLELFRSRLTAWLATAGVEAPEETARVLGAALDGVMLHRALDPGLTSGVVEPMLRRLLAPTPVSDRTDGHEEQRQGDR